MRKLEKSNLSILLLHMARRKNALGLSQPTQTMIVGFLLIFAAILVFFAQKDYLARALVPVF